MASLTQEDLLRSSVGLAGGSPGQAQDLIICCKLFAEHYKVKRTAVYQQATLSLYKRHTGPQAIAAMKEILL